MAVDGYTWTGVSACLIGVPPWRFPSRSSWILFVASCSWSPQCSSLVLLLGLLALVSPSVLHPSQLSQVWLSSMFVWFFMVQLYSFYGLWFRL